MTNRGCSGAAWRAARRASADRDFAARPALRVDVLALIGDLERRSGHPERAQQSLDEAAALAKAQFGGADGHTLHIEYLLARSVDELGNVRDARARLEKALAAYESGPARDTREEVQAVGWLAGLDERAGNSARAIELGERTLALARRALPADDIALTDGVMNLGWILMDAGQAARAEPLLREGLQRKRARFGEQHADVADATAILAALAVRLH